MILSDSDSNTSSAKANSPILRMRGITKRFDGTIALSGVDFNLWAGEVHILAGENGAGKSTLIKVLCGVHRDYEGSIEMEGRPVRFSSPQDAAIHGISAIHQELSLVPSMSVSDNIFLGRERRGSLGFVDFTTQETTGNNILQSLGVFGVDVKQPVEDYPISIQQMIEITKALSMDSRIIIMDEPTSALTEPEVKRLFETILALKSRGHAVIYITHKMEEIYQIGDRITVLRDGHLIASAPVSEMSRTDLIRHMVGRELSEQIPRHRRQYNQELLRVENLGISDRHGRRKLVDDVSFSVRKGEILGIAGLQGSGASELLNGIFGAYGPVANKSIFLDGKPFTIHSPAYSIAQGLALLTNDRKTTGLVLSMSILENITLASLPRFSPLCWMRRKWEAESARKRRSELNIKAINIYSEVSSLSGGTQQKVALAKWIETKPRVLLLDEPTRGIDVATKHEVYELMNAWTDAGCAIILITSEMPELIALSDRIIVMHRGRIAARLEGADITQENILHAAMGREEI